MNNDDQATKKLLEAFKDKKREVTDKDCLMYNDFKKNFFKQFGKDNNVVKEHINI